MSTIIEAKAVISAEDRTGRAFDAIARKFAQVGKGAKVSAEVDRLARSLDRARKQGAAVDDFMRRRETFTGARARLRETQIAVENAARAMKVAERPTRALEVNLQRAQRAVSRANKDFESQKTLFVQSARAAREMGLPMAMIERQQGAIRSSIDATTAAIGRQIRMEQRHREVRELLVSRRGEAAARLAAREQRGAARAREAKELLVTRRGEAAKRETAIEKVRIGRQREAKELLVTRRSERRDDLVRQRAARWAEADRQRAILNAPLNRPERQPLAETLTEAGIGAGAVGIVKGTYSKSVAGWTEMDEATRRQRAILGMDEESQALLQKQALRIGQDTRFSNPDVVKSQTRIGSSLPDHLKSNKVIAAITENSKDYALAMSTTMDEASEALLGRMLAMRYDMSSPEAAGASAKRAANRLVQFAKSSGASHNDVMGYTKFGAAPGQVGGFSEEFADALGAQLRRIGYEGSMAGNFVRAAATKLAVPTSKGQAALAAAGINHSDYVTPGKDLSADNLSSVLKLKFGKGLNASQHTRIADLMSDETVVGDREEFVPKVSAILQEILAKRTKKGQVNAQDAERIAKSVDGYLTATAGSVDIERLMRDVIAGGIKPALAKYLFGQEHGGRAQSLDARTLDKDQASFRKTPEDRAQKVGVDINAGAYGAYQRLIGSIETLYMRIGQVNDAPLRQSWDSIGNFIDAISGAPDKILQFGSAVSGATLLLTSLKGGAAAGAALGIPGAAAASTLAGTAIRTVPWAAAGYVFATTVSGVLTQLAPVVAGKYWRPTSDEEVGRLRQAKAETEKKLEDVTARIHPAMRDNPNPEVDRLKALVADLQNRIDAAPVSIASALPGSPPMKGVATASFGPSGPIAPFGPKMPWDLAPGPAVPVPLPPMRPAAPPPAPMLPPTLTLPSMPTSAGALPQPSMMPPKFTMPEITAKVLPDQVQAKLDGRVPVDVTGKVDAEVKGAATVTIQVIGGGEVTNTTSSGNIRATGTSMARTSSGFVRGGV